MKVFVVTSGVPKQNEIFSGIFGFDQAKALSRLGLNVVVLALDLRSLRHKRKMGYSSYEQNGIRVEAMNFPCGRIPLRLRCIIGEILFRNLYQKACAKFGKPDILHAHFFVTSYLCAQTARKNRIPLIITEHSSIIGKEKATSYETKIAKKAYATAIQLLSVSSALARSVEKMAGKKVQVVPNVLNSIFTIPLDSGNKAEEPCPVFRLVACGRLVKGKGYDTLLNAFSKCDYTHATLTIIGAGVEEESLKTLANDLHIAEQVIFKGYCTRQQIREIYLHSDCFVLASRFETFGLVYAEAMACGLPIIATRCEGTNDYVTSDNSILVDVDDVAGLTNAIETIRRNLQCFDKQAISKQAISVFSSEKVANILSSLYESISTI